jgi:Putative transposase DNA-binding domain
MASALTDSTAVAALPQRRGKSKAPNFSYSGPMSVIPLELDASDDCTRIRLERQWKAVFRLRRALQRDGQKRCRAYWAAHNERTADPKALRTRLGLTRKGMEAAAKAHIEASGWMRHHMTKAIGLHLANEVWETVDRHLFRDSSDRRHGAPRIGSWWNFTRIPGRARSHTKARPVWETWRLVGTLDGHLDAYRHPELPETVTTGVAAAMRPSGTSILAQPARLSAPNKSSGSWLEHQGVLAVVFTGLPGGDVVLPVRLPQGAGQWSHLVHFLADPGVWHKIDLVRVQDRHAPGGWRYYAHLLVHQPGYESPATLARRNAIPTGRRAGIDANVSNLSLASFPSERSGELVVEQITQSAEQQASAEEAARRARARQRALDRSRRTTNPDQYERSARQVGRADRRTERGLPAKQVTTPGGARAARTDGTPMGAYRYDTLSHAYHRTRADHAADARARSQAKRARARDSAAAIVDTHGNMLTIEDGAVSAWARLWGKQIQGFSPGMLITALAAECQATGGQLQRAGTRSTALSQHCLCGQRVPKRLSQRTHWCPKCGLCADRDIVSAVLAACVELADPDDPASARVNYELARALRAGLTCQQEDRAQSTGTSPKRDHRAGLARAGSLRRRPLLSNATITRPTPEQTSITGRREDQPNTKLHKRFGGSMIPQGSTLSPAASSPPASSAPAR